MERREAGPPEEESGGPHVTSAELRNLLREELSAGWVRDLAREVAAILVRSGWCLSAPLSAESIDRLTHFIEQLGGAPVNLRENAYIRRLRRLAEAGIGELQITRALAAFLWEGRGNLSPQWFEVRTVSRYVRLAAQHTLDLAEWVRGKQTQWALTREISRHGSAGPSASERADGSDGSPASPS